MKRKIAVFASGNGSNFQALIDQQANEEALYEIVLLVCDRPHAYAIERAKEAGIPFFTFKVCEFPDKESYEAEICHKLQKYEVEWVILAGYMRLVGEKLLKVYNDRIINIHPSLLPSFKGKKAIEEAYEYGVRVTGVTVHFVDEGMDSGAIIAQEAVLVDEQDSLESLTAKIHQVEHQILPRVVNQLMSGNVQLDGRRR